MSQASQSLSPSLNTVPLHFSGFLSSEVIEIVAQSGQKRFFAHRNVLIAQSKSLCDPARETGERKIDLSAWDGDIVERFLQFLYIGNYQFSEPVPENEDIGEEALGGVGGQGDLGATVGDTSTLLVHAKLYALAQYTNVELLQTMAFGRLWATLINIEEYMGLRAKMNTVKLLQYVYSQEASQPSKLEEPIYALVLNFVAKNFERLVDQIEMKLLLSEGGELAVGLMEKVAERLCDTEWPCDARELCVVEGELQYWRARATASEKKVRQLKTANADKVQKLEAEVRLLENSNAEKERILDLAEAALRKSQTIIMRNVWQLENTCSSPTETQQSIVKVQGSRTSSRAGMQKMHEDTKQMMGSTILHLDNLTKTICQLKAKVEWFEVTCPEKAQEYRTTHTHENLR